MVFCWSNSFVFLGDIPIQSTQIRYSKCKLTCFLGIPNNQHQKPPINWFLAQGTQLCFRFLGRCIKGRQVGSVCAKRLLCTVSDRGAAICWVNWCSFEKSFQAFLFGNAHRFGFLLASPSRKPMESILPGYRIILVRVKQGNLLKSLPVGLVHTPHAGGQGPLPPTKAFKMMNLRRDRNRFHVPQTNRNTCVIQ